jgi:hypothetical protein
MAALRGDISFRYLKPFFLVYISFAEIDAASPLEYFIVSNYAP